IVMMSPCICEDFILRPEACRHQWETGEGETANKESPKSNGHFLAQTAHVEHVLWVNVVITRMQNAVLHTVNDRAGAEEEQRLEEGVSNQVEGSRHIRANAQRGDHEAELGNGRVRQHALDVI